MLKNIYFEKALQGSENDYWEILSITTNLFYYYLFRTEDTMKIPVMVFKKPIIHKI
jgi:hypothetical protein